MTAKIKLNAASGGGSVSIQAPSSSSNNRVYTLPDTASFSTLGGILEVDQWYLSTDVTSSGDITSNLVRNNFTASAAPLGTGMSESSGIFSFPITGKYMIIVHARFSIDASDSVNVATMLTTNNSSYAVGAYASDGNNGSGARDGASTSLYFADVTDVGQVKVKFNAGSISGSSKVSGNASLMQSSFSFIRLGDT